jgi:hypothetical protein
MLITYIFLLNEDLNDPNDLQGKFIRVWFNNMGRMAGGDIETYLLEKSRVTYQSPNEREDTLRPMQSKN